MCVFVLLSFCLQVSVWCPCSLEVLWSHQFQGGKNPKSSHELRQSQGLIHLAAHAPPTPVHLRGLFCPSSVLTELEKVPLFFSLNKKSTHRKCFVCYIILMKRIWWKCKLGQPVWKIVWRFLKKLIIELPYDCAIPLLGIYPKDMKS